MNITPNELEIIEQAIQTAIAAESDDGQIRSYRQVLKRIHGQDTGSINGSGAGASTIASTGSAGASSASSRMSHSGAGAGANATASHGLLQSSLNAESGAVNFDDGFRYDYDDSSDLN